MKRIIYSMMMCFLLLAACSTEDDEKALSGQREEIKVAVILPFTDGMQSRWERTMSWALQNIEIGQENQPKGVSIAIEWYDEDAVDIEETVGQLVDRDDIKAIIGPMYSANAMQAAKKCSKSEKTLFTTTASSAELIRACANKQYLWALTETDISQCEVLLSKAMLYGAKTVSLLAKEDMYGQTFIDWFAFQAKELGLTVDGICSYTDETVRQSYSTCVKSGSDYIICIPSSTDNLKEMLYARQETIGAQSQLLFSDVAYSPSMINQLGTMSQGIEGVAMSGDPSSGFSISYEVKFGEQPLLGEAQAYDAIMMVAYAAFIMQQTGETDMNQALCRLVDGREENPGSWRAEDMYSVFNALASGKSPDIKGASGSLDFDGKVYTNVLHTVYANWMVYNDKFIILDYNTSDGGNRTDATLAGWNWKNSQSQEFDNNSSSLTYPTLKSKWALIVAASTGWSNYRHQADALEMYRLLKKQGYTDDRIVLVMEDDIANNPDNPHEGVVRVQPSGENLYQNVLIDYKLSSITPNDIGLILRGGKSERLPEVISADDTDNVLIFWSGHGAPGCFVWNEDERFAADLMRTTLQTLAMEKKYRKMLWLTEACYAGSVAKESEGLPGIMFITAAAENETSKADTFNDELGVWMTNHFTSTLEEQINLNPSISLRDLYFKLFRNTVGSHVTIYNQPNFDNLYQCTMKEFL